MSWRDLIQDKVEGENSTFRDAFGNAFALGKSGQSASPISDESSEESSFTRRKVLRQGSLAIVGITGLSITPVKGSDPEPKVFRARHQDSVSCVVGGEKQYSFGHEVVYDVLTTGVQFVESNISHYTSGEWQYAGESGRDSYIEYDDGFEKEAGGLFRHYLAPYEVQTPYVDIRVFSDGAARTEHKFSDCPDCLNC